MKIYIPIETTGTNYLCDGPLHIGKRDMGWECPIEVSGHYGNSIFDMEQYQFCSKECLRDWSVKLVDENKAWSPEEIDRTSALM